MAAPLLLDTCATIWITNEEPISLPTSEAIRRAREDDEPIFVSPITAWELGLLVSRGRMILQMPPELLIASSFLPGTPPRDPADRILAATARQYGYALVTRDRLLLDYAEQGHIQALAC